MIRGVVTVFGVLAILILVSIGSLALWKIGQAFYRVYETSRERKRQREIDQLQRMAGKKKEEE